MIRALHAKEDELHGAVDSSERPPILVHCSAGVGRSGAVVAIDHCIRHIDKRKAGSIDAVCVHLGLPFRNF